MVKTNQYFAKGNEQSIYIIITKLDPMWQTRINETLSSTWDLGTVIMINLLYALTTLSKNFEINISDQLLNVSLQRKKPHILKELPVIFFMYTIIPERALEMKIILNASERRVYISSRIWSRDNYYIVCAQSN